MKTALIRPAVPADAETLAKLHRHVREACLPYLPRLHSPLEDHAFFRDHVLPASTVQVAEADGMAVGFAAWRPGWLDHLYVHPDWQGLGIGSRLLAVATDDLSAVRLWVFQRNVAARRFYEARGFGLVRLTDGSGNEENEPDALYAWPRD
ncbi:GNAT family N-acetyltransferase [Microvirga pudoricolor]|uniref:GNAT family N-acetyltransferase n=1 Tax=Microvirga pudoricolor TaxID=2778729 RepID=UPI001951A348|nr:GNAT family N-acetyltransferase [Microvirga pudoricolor]MBM6596565.1 GNAT family N-acetyltransferase [Microvirga pudoricolor]